MNDQSNSVSASDEAPTAVLVGPPVAIVESTSNETTSSTRELTFREALSRTLDDVDALADAVARALGLRDQ